MPGRLRSAMARLPWVILPGLTAAGLLFAVWRHLSLEGSAWQTTQVSRAGESVDQLLSHHREGVELLGRVLAAASDLPQWMDPLSGQPGALDTWLEEMAQELDSDSAAIFDASGRLLSIVPQRFRSAPALRADSQPLIERALAEGVASGFVVSEERFWSLAAVAIVRRFDVIGLVLTGRELDRERLRTAVGVSGSEIAVMAAEGTEWRVVASSLDPTSAALLSSAVPSGLAQVHEPFDLELGDRRYQVASRRLALAGSGEVVVVVSLIDTTDWRRARSELLSLLGGVVGASLLLATLATFWLGARRALHMTLLARQVELVQRGSLEDLPDLPSEMAEISRMVSTWQQERREQDRFDRVVELALQRSDGMGGDRIPDCEDGLGSSPTPPVLVALESRGHADISSAAHSAWLEAARSVLVTTRGRFEGQLGRRLFATFDGPDGLLRALAAVAQVGGHSSPDKSNQSAAVVVTGSVHRQGVGAAELLTGSAVARAEALLREVQSGELLVADEVRRSLAASFSQAGIQPQERVGLFGPSSLFALDFASASLVVAGLTAHGATDRTVGQSANGARPLKLGSVLADRYELTAWRGAGSQLVEYLAWDRSEERQVIVQEIKRGVWEAPLEQYRLRRSLALARRLRHENILQPLSFFAYEGRLVVTVELFQGLRLDQVLGRAGPLPVPAGLFVARRLAWALAAAHSQKLCHFDLTPERIWLGMSGRVQVANFGVAPPLLRDRGKAADGGLLVGGVHCVAPEQIDGPVPDSRSDIYSCGAVLYEAFTGRRLFETATPMGVLGQHLEERPRPPRDWAPQLPGPIEAVILRCLEKKPDDRFSDGGELGEALARVGS